MAVPSDSGKKRFAHINSRRAFCRKLGAMLHKSDINVARFDSAFSPRQITLSPAACCLGGDVTVRDRYPDSTQEQVQKIVDLLSQWGMPYWVGLMSDYTGESQGCYAVSVHVESRKPDAPSCKDPG